MLAVVLVILGSGFVLKTLSGGAYQETDVLIAHMRALSVGESLYGEIVARLSATGWTLRWFKDAPDAQTNVSIAGGTVDYTIRDVPPAPAAAGAPAPLTPPSAHQADLLIRATYEGHSVLMFWRLSCPDDSIDALSQVIPSLYLSPLAATGSAGTAADPSPLTQLVSQQIAQRETNRAQTDSILGPLRDASGPGEVQAVLGFTPPRPVADGTLVGNPAGPDIGTAAPPAPVTLASAPPPPRATPSVPAPAAGLTPATPGSGPFIDWQQAVGQYVNAKQSAVAAAQAAATTPPPTGTIPPHGNWDGTIGSGGAGHDHAHTHADGTTHDHWHPYGHHQ